jgi:hypothetical protein
MGGRISGESPREEKVEVRGDISGAERATHAKVAGKAVTLRFERQRSRQQLIACPPFGQHESWDITDCEVAVV